VDETIPPGPEQTLDTLGPIDAPGADPIRWPGMIWGMGLAVGLHVTLAGLLAGLHAIPHKSAAELLSERLEETPEDMHVIQTKLVKLGKMRNRRRLPDRIQRQVAALAPDARVGTPEDIAIARSGKAPTKAMEKAPNKEATPEDLAKTLERAKILAQVGDDRAVEGSPEGVRDGEIGPEEARPLDLYVTLLTRLIRQRWTAPSLPPEELSGLRCVVSVQVQRDLTVGAVRIAQSSGNQSFDDSAVEAVRRFEREVGTFPPPPDQEVADAIFGRAVTIRFRKTTQ
jgi:TonB family protein